MVEVVHTEEELKLRTIFASSPDAIAVIDLSGRITECNPAALDMLGHLTRGEVIGRSAFEFVAEKEREKATGEFEKALKQGPTRNVDYTCLTKDGREFPAEITSNVIKDRSGNPTGFVTIIKDVTERRRAEEKYKTLVEQSLEGIVVAQGVPPRVVFANPAMIRISGYTQEELASLSLELLIHPDDRATFFSRLKERFDGKPSTSPSEYRAIRKDDKVVWIELLSNLIIHNGKPAVQATFIDVTECKKAEEKLSESEEKFRELANSLPEIVFQTDVRGKLTFANRGASDITGYTQEDLDKGLYAIQFIAPEEQERARENQRKLIIQGKSVASELTFVRKDGSTFPAIARSTPIIRENKVVGIRGIVVDITDRKKAEKEARDLAKFPGENPAPVLRVANDGAIVYCNTAARLVLSGRKLEINQPAPDFLLRLIAEALQSNAKKKFEEEFGERAFSFLIVPVPAAGYVNIYGHDITERKEMEDALRRSEEKYRKLFEEAMDAIFVADAETGIIIDCNRAASEFVGREKSELIGEHQRILHPQKEIGEGISRTFRQHLKEEGRVLETQVITKNKEIKEVAIKANLLELGGRKALQGIFRDITERKKMEAELRSQRDKTQMYLDVAGIMLVALDNEGRVQLVNRYGRELLGGSEEDVLGKNFFDVFLPPLRRDPAKAFHRGLMEGDLNFEKAHLNKGSFMDYFEGPLLTLKGEERFCSWYTTPLRDAEGRIVGAFSSVADITEQKGLIDALGESEERYRALFQESPVAIREEDFSEAKKYLDHLRESGVSDFEEYFRNRNEEVVHCASLVRNLDVNKAAMTMFHAVTKKESFASLAEYFFEKVTQEVYDRFRAQFVAIAEGRTTFEKESSLQTETGEKRTHIVKWMAAPGCEQTLARVIVTVVDITERIRMENELKKYAERLEELVSKRTGELRRSEERYRSFFENSPISVWVEDYSEVKQYLDRLRASGIENLQTYLGDHPELIIHCASMVKVTDINEKTLRLFEAEDENDFLSGITRFLDKESLSSFEGELLAISQGYEAFEGLETEVVLRSMKGNIINAILKWTVVPGFEKDLSKVLVSLIDVTDRKRLEDELRRAERLIVIGETAAQVGHDLRNPLQAMTNLMHLMKNGKENANCSAEMKTGHEKTLESMRRQVVYMDKIVSDLQDYAAPTRLNLAETPFRRLVEETLSTLEIPENVNTSVSIPENLQLKIDPDKMSRVLANMFTNAVQAMPGGGQLVVEASRSGENTSIVIEDTGVGIPQETAIKMFDPFYTTKSKGQGLGLAVCKRLVEAHGGTITMKSREGKGTAFTIKMPLK